MTYCTADEVYATAGISSTEISEANINNFILLAEGEVDKKTNTTYWNVENSGTASSATSNTITQSGAGWTADAYNDMYVWIYGGTGVGQARLITDGDIDTLTVDRNWDVTPDNTSTFRIIYAHTSPYIDGELRDGNDTDTLFTNKYPLKILEAVTIDSTSVTPSYIYQYEATGKLVLGSSAEFSYWTSKRAQKNELDYWYGVYPLPYEVKRLVLVYAALKALMAQAGGTFNVPSTYSLPEGSVTIGQAYINIRGAWDMLNKERLQLEKVIFTYPSFA